MGAAVVDAKGAVVMGTGVGARVSGTTGAGVVATTGA
jgi:hypothetical protein